MATLRCARCGSNAEGLQAAPLPGDVGSLVHAGTCASCWKEWLGAQVNLINENKLSPANPEQYEWLVTEMKKYLHLDEG